jgi:hypothetical protein
MTNGDCKKTDKENRNITGIAIIKILASLNNSNDKNNILSPFFHHFLPFFSSGLLFWYLMILAEAELILLYHG